MVANMEFPTQFHRIEHNIPNEVQITYFLPETLLPQKKDHELQRTLTGRKK